tara:strand:+ start:4620 stop:4865 length:246 start_codon:yes stop_codon:yes gene_type:complete
MTRLQTLKDFRDDVKNIHKFLNEEGQDKTINIVDPNQDLKWLGHSVETLLNWIAFEIKEEDEEEDEALPDEGLRVGATVGE